MILRTTTQRILRETRRGGLPPLPAPCGRRALLAAPMLAVLLACACGGSGSSGFDGALDDEADAIALATLEGSCVEFKRNTYCASGAPVTIGGETAVVDFETVPAVPCTPESGEPGCTGEVGFEPGGFPEGTVFLGAWADDENGPWTLSSVNQADPGGGETSGDVVVMLPDDGGGALVVAVLAYFDGVPEDLPDVARRLRDFEPDVVYIDDTVEVAPEPVIEGEAVRDPS